MKILNRPMFRMGGPIKEGIMNGIQEPKRQGYNVSGMVFPGDADRMLPDASKVFADVEKINYCLQQVLIKVQWFLIHTLIKDEDLKEGMNTTEVIKNDFLPL